MQTADMNLGIIPIRVNIYMSNLVICQDDF